MNESDVYRTLAVSMLPFGGLLIILGWLMGGGGSIIELNVVSGSLVIGGAALATLGPWMVLLRYRTILRRRRKETP